MKRLLYLLLLTPIIYLASCSKSSITPEVENLYGCTDTLAFNFDSLATVDDSSCSYQMTYVPDDNFEQALINLGYDNVLDDSVLTTNIDTVTYLNIDNQSIADLTGIASFTALKTLYCSDNPLTSLDVSENTNLQILICQSTFLNGLDVSENVNLTTLACTSGDGNNYIPNLDLSQNTALVYLSCQRVGLTNLDLSQNTALVSLSCSSNWSLTTLDLSNNTALVYLDCTDNPLTSLDIRNGNNTNMANISVYECYNLTCINVDDALWSTTNWTNIDSQQYFSTNCQ
jgi:hypothetical protein